MHFLTVKLILSLFFAIEHPFCRSSQKAQTLPGVCVLRSSTARSDRSSLIFTRIQLSAPASSGTIHHTVAKSLAGLLLTSSLPARDRPITTGRDKKRTTASHFAFQGDFKGRMFSRRAPTQQQEADDGEEAHFSCRICFEDSKPSQVRSAWAVVFLCLPRQRMQCPRPPASSSCRASAVVFAAALAKRSSRAPRRCVESCSGRLVCGTALHTLLGMQHPHTAAHPARTPGIGPTTHTSPPCTVTPHIVKDIRVINTMAIMQQMLAACCT